MPASGYFSFLDYGREGASFSFNTGPVTALTIAGLLTEFGALRSATAAITLGTITDEAQYAWRTNLDNTKPTDPNAQRERKWLVTYEDNTATLGVGIDNPGYKKVFNTEIPTADLSKLTTDTDIVDLTQTEIADWVTAFEAIAKSPYGGSAHVLQIAAVGRNL